MISRRFSLSLEQHANQKTHIVLQERVFSFSPFTSISNMLGVFPKTHAFSLSWNSEYHQSFLPYLPNTHQSFRVNGCYTSRLLYVLQCQVRFLCKTSPFSVLLFFNCLLAFLSPQLAWKLPKDTNCSLSTVDWNIVRCLFHFFVE